jgi:hypothetical protein
MRSSKCATLTGAAFFCLTTRLKLSSLVQQATGPPPFLETPIRL